MESRFSINEQILKRNMKNHSLVVQRIVYKGSTSEYIMWYSDYKQENVPWYEKTAEVENKEHQVAGKNCKEEIKKNSLKIIDVQAANEVTLKSGSKLAGTCDTSSTR